MLEFSFVLTKNLSAFTEKNGSLVCIPPLQSSYECQRSEACQILPIITFVYCSSFPVLLFSSFLSLDLH